MDAKLPAQREPKNLFPIDKTKDAVSGLIQEAYKKTGEAIAKSKEYPAMIEKIRGDMGKEFDKTFRETYSLSFEYYIEPENENDLKDAKEKMIAELGNANLINKFSREDLVRAVSWYEARDAALQKATEFLGEISSPELSTAIVDAPWHTTDMIKADPTPPKIIISGVKESVEEYFSMLGEEMVKENKIMKTDLVSSIYTANVNAHKKKEHEGLTMDVKIGLANIGLHEDLYSVALPILIKHLNAEAEKRKLPLIFGTDATTGELQAIWNYTGLASQELARREPTEFQKERMA